ncbi:hypothetical protein JXA70_14445 [candidate division KSB1 bacterium]|nr:hypothetical protein [candidate division KSB1 bacterium]
MPSVPFDICVITAANEQQARGFDKQLERNDSSQHDTIYKVIPDPDGKRIGSGGSSFYVLNLLYDEFGDALFAKRVLVLHSGGDSRRLPAYSAVGKLFMPLPTEKHHTLFDVMLENYAQCPYVPPGQVIFASGDVLLNFDPSFVKFSPHGITGVAYAEKPEDGAFYGVYVVQEPQPGYVPVYDVLQKPGLQALRDHAAIDFSNRIWIDTGILNLAPDAVKAWVHCKKLIDAARSGIINYNLYHEILYAIHGKRELEDSDKLQNISFFVNCLPYCGFYHVGKSRELLQNFYSLTHASMHYHFQNSTRSNAVDYPELKSAWIYNSVIKTSDLSVKDPCLIEGCIIQQKLSLDGYNILTNTPATTPVHLSAGMCLNVLPLVSGEWVAVLYGIDDEFKGQNATFLNKPLPTFLSKARIEHDDLWPSEENNELWHARLFPCSTSPATAIEAVLTLQDGVNISQWRAATRISMFNILLHVDQDRLSDMHAQIESGSFFYNLERQWDQADFTYKTLQAAVKSPDEKSIAIAQLKKWSAQLSDRHIDRARAQFWLAQLLLEKNSKEAEASFEASFDSIRDAVAAGLGHAYKRLDKTAFGIRSDEVVWTMLPARLDFAGGWTDTPPVCLERGGCVLNASVTLNGQYPIQVIGKIKPNDPTIGINSIDLGQRATISSFAELRAFSDPAHWLALPKAAFYAASIFDLAESGSLQNILENLGGGIDLTLFSALPAGSGLGTSSILGAGLIATLARIMGVLMSRDELYARTSHLEQLMTTGGGWQDQIGGVAGGVKLITTAAGYDQTPNCAWTHLKQPGTEIGERFLLYYTGIRRMAKNLLRQVVGRYLNKESDALVALERLAQLAKEMKDDLDHRRIDSFGAKICAAWGLNKSLDAGQTTDDIENILARIDDYMLGAKLLGAGGGGFLFIVAKDKQAGKKIQKLLTEHPPNNRARFFDFDIDVNGMRMSVL